MTAPAFVVDLEARELVVKGRTVEVTETELRLAAYLSNQVPRRFVPREELLERVWGYPANNTRVLDTTVKRLRDKLVAAGCGPCLENRRGYGYRLAGGLERG